MSALPTIPTTTGESWETVETARRLAAEHLDVFIESVVNCDCDHTVDGLEHFDATQAIAHERYEGIHAIYPFLFAEAVARLAAARKAGLL